MDSISNPVTGERVVFLEGAGDPKAPRLTFDFFLAPGGGVLVPHQHLRLTETLHVRAGVLLAGPPGQERRVGPGESITFTPGQGHTLKNVGEGELHAFTEFTPAGTAESFLRNYYGLCRDGFTDASGELPLPALAMLIPAHDNWRADIPIWVQRALFFVLRPVAWLRGFKPTYPQYSGDRQGGAQARAE